MQINLVNYQKNPLPQEGFLFVNPKSAILLQDVNLNSKMDPYVIINYGNQSSKSTVHMSGHMKPSWPENLIFIPEQIGYLEIEVWNYVGSHSNHDFLGVAFVSLDHLYFEKTIELFCD